MDCETCKAELSSFLYGETDDLRSAAVRRHVDACARCNEELERLSATRAVVRAGTDVEPSADLDAPVLAAAARYAAERRLAAASGAPPRRTLVTAGGSAGAATVSTPPGWSPPRSPAEGGASAPSWSRIIGWLGGMAMRPQVAMALLLVLMVGVGLWYLPQARRAAEWMRAEVAADHDDDPASVVTAVEEDDAGASTLDPESDTPRANDRGQRRWVRRDPATKMGATAPVARTTGTLPARGPDVAVVRTRVDPSSSDAADAGPASVASATEPSAVPNPDGTVVAPAPSQASAPEPAQEATFDEPIAANLYARAMNHYRAGRYGEAIDELGAVTRRTDAASLVPRAYLNLARSHRASGNLPTAARTYEALLSRYPGFGQRSQAMWEAAVLYRRLGQLGRSRALLERLVEVPSHATRARRELVMVNQGERAAAATTVMDPASSVEGGL